VVWDELTDDERREVGAVYAIPFAPQRSPGTR
jgi:hypothetical protein